MDLPETVDPSPWKVRVAQQKATAVGRAVLAEGPGVGAQWRVEQACLTHGVCRVGKRDGGCSRRRGRRWPGTQDGISQRSGGGLHGRQLSLAPELGQGHGLDPGLAVTGRWQLAGLVAQVTVVAVHRATCQRQGLGTGVTGPGTLQGRIVHVRRHKEVNLFIGQHAPRQQPWRGTAKVARALATHGDQLVGRHADVVLRVGIGHGVGQGLGVSRCDVGHAVGGAHNGGGACIPGTGWTGTGAQEYGSGHGNEPRDRMGGKSCCTLGHGIPRKIELL